jgi:hypothetical protein
VHNHDTKSLMLIIICSQDSVHVIFILFNMHNYGYEYNIIQYPETSSAVVFSPVSHAHTNRLCQDTLSMHPHPA